MNRPPTQWPSGSPRRRSPRRRSPTQWRSHSRSQWRSHSPAQWRPRVVEPTEDEDVVGSTEDEDEDVVVEITPHVTHRLIDFDPVNNRKNIVCEKPEMTLEEYYKKWARPPLKSFRIPYHPHLTDTTRPGVTDHVVKFLCTPVEVSTSHTEAHNIQNIGELIENLFGLSPDCEDEALSDLLFKMRTSTVQHEKEFLYHLSIATPTQAINFIRNVGDGSPKLVMQDSLESAITAIDPCDGWDSYFDSDNLGRLKMSWSKGKAYLYQKSEKSAEQCANDGENYVTSFKVKESLFRCARNLASHMKDGPPTYHKTNEPVSVMIMKIFGKHLIEVAHKVGTKLNDSWFE